MIGTEFPLKKAVLSSKKVCSVAKEKNKGPQFGSSVRCCFCFHFFVFGWPSFDKAIFGLRTKAISWRDVKVVNNTAYIVSEAPDHGMQVFDLTLLRNKTGFHVSIYSRTDCLVFKVLRVELPVSHTSLCQFLFSSCKLTTKTGADEKDFCCNFLTHDDVQLIH